MNLRAKNFLIISSVIAFALILILSFVYFDNKRKEENTPNPNLGSIKDNSSEKIVDLGFSSRTCRTVKTPYVVQENYTKKANYTKEVCGNVSLEYSKTFEGFKKNECVKYDILCTKEEVRTIGGDLECVEFEDFCKEKKLSYSVNLTNKDEEKGEWGVNITFYIEGNYYNNSEIFFQIENGTNQIFNFKQTIYGEDENGEANKTFSGSSEIIFVPEVEVCKDVLVDNSSIEIRNKTFYREEEVCEEI